MDLGTTVIPGGEQMPSEWELIEKAKAGDKTALGDLVSDCWQPLYRFVSYKLGSTDEAQDITQETFFRAFRSLSSYQKTDSRFGTSFCRIASNLITDLWRKKSRTPILQEISEQPCLPSGDNNPAELLVTLETKETLAVLLAELPLEQRQVIEYRILAGLPVKEVATAMDKSEAAVKMLQQRALKTLREKLLAKGGWADK